MRFRVSDNILIEKDDFGESAFFGACKVDGKPANHFLDQEVTRLSGL
jgi:hypothetical protein